MALETSGFNFELPQQGIASPALASITPYKPEFTGEAFQPLPAPNPSIQQGIAAALGSLGQGIQVGYENKQKNLQIAQEQADKDREFAFQQQKYKDELGFKQRSEARAVDERMRAVGAEMQANKFPGESGVPSGAPTEAQTSAMSETTPPKLQGAGVVGKPSLDLVPPSSSDVVKPTGKPSIDVTPPTINVVKPNLGENKPSTTITPPTFADTLQVTPSFVTKAPVEATYIPPTPVETPAVTTEQDAAVRDAIGTATARPIQELAPYVGASLNGAPSLPLTQTPPPTISYHDKMVQMQKAQDEAVAASKQGQPLYNLDLSGLKQTQEQSAPQNAEKVPTFAIPPRPTADQIPQDFTTADYNKARQEQAKDYGFYYEPLGRIETHLDPATGQQWYKVTRNPEAASVIESKIKNLDTMAQRYDRMSLQQQNTVDREQGKFSSIPVVRNFEAPNGMRQSFARFIKDYDAIAKNPEASGISDIGLLDMFGRAEGGGKITEGQAALALQSVGIMDKPELLIQKLQGGARLSQPQRDQMLRVIADDHAAQANMANQAIEMTRKKLQKLGIKDEDMLPQPYIVPITKWEAQEKIKGAQAEVTQLQLAKVNAQQTNDAAKLAQINQRMNEIQKELDPLGQMMKKSKGSAILNLYDMEHSPQGWAGGAVTTFQQQP